MILRRRRGWRTSNRTWRRLISPGADRPRQAAPSTFASRDQRCILSTRIKALSAVLVVVPEVVLAALQVRDLEAPPTSPLVARPGLPAVLVLLVALAASRM